MRWVIFLLFLPAQLAFSAEEKLINLAGSRIVLASPESWTIKTMGAEVGTYAPEVVKKGRPPARIHFARVKGEVKTLQEAIDAEIDKITSRSPGQSSSCDRQSYKGSAPVRTKSGIEGLRADFWSEGPAGRSYAIVKYYFFDEAGKPFKVCSHVYGDQRRFEAFESVILDGLAFPPR